MKIINIKVAVPEDTPQEIFNDMGEFLNEKVDAATREYIKAHDLKWSCGSGNCAREAAIESFLDFLKKVSEDMEKTMAKEQASKKKPAKKEAKKETKSEKKSIFKRKK